MTGTDNNEKSNNQNLQIVVSKVDKYTEIGIQCLYIGIAQDGQPYVYFVDDKNWVVMPLRGRKLKRWFRKRALALGDYLRDDDLSEIMENLNAIAAVDDVRLQVNNRVALNAQGDIEIDLGTHDQHRVLLKNGIASIIEKGSQTLFNQPETMLPLPKPATTGDWKKLLPFFNLIDDHQYLLLGWISFVLTHPKGTVPYPILIAIGPQGCGKSVLSRLIRALVDNNSAGVQLFPSEIRDMAISSLSQYILIYDNVSSLSKAWSDKLCVFSTSGSISFRRLYSDDEETLLLVHAALILNGINSFVVESDLASRCVTVRLLPMDDDKRRDEAEINRDLDSKLPEIFRGLLDLCAKILQVEQSVKVLHPERLMSFSRWLAAMEQVLELPAGKLQKAYSENLRESALETVAENALAITVLKFATKHPGKPWIGTATDLLVELNKLAPPNTVHRQAEWPQTPISLSKRLKQIAPLLKAQGVECGFSHGTQRQIEITYTPPETAKPLDGLDEPVEIAESNVKQLDLAACGPTDK